MAALDKTIMLFYYPTLSLLNFSLKLRRFFTLLPDFLRTTPTGSRTSRTLASRSSWESSRMNWMSCGSKCRFSAWTNVTTSSVTSGSGADSLTETTFVVINTCIEKKKKRAKFERYDKNNSAQLDCNKSAFEAWIDFCSEQAWTRQCKSSRNCERANSHFHQIKGTKSVGLWIQSNLHVLSPHVSDRLSKTPKFSQSKIYS